MHKFLTKRFIFSAVGLGIATWLCYSGKIDGGAWVYALAVIIAGHHAEDIIRAYRNVTH